MNYIIACPACLRLKTSYCVKLTPLLVVYSGGAMTCEVLYVHDCLRGFDNASASIR